MFRLRFHLAYRYVPHRSNAFFVRQSLRYTSTTARVVNHGNSSPASSLPVSGTIKLRSYQEECIQSVLSNLEEGHTRLGISLATGSGKTVIFTQLIDRVKPKHELSTRTLILAHRRELVEQAARHCSLAYPDKTIDIEMGSLHASGTADITVASVQSITSGSRLEKFDPAFFKLILVDEAHHIVASRYLDVLDHFGVKDQCLPPEETRVPALIGVSATFSRFDGRALGQVIDRIVYHKDYVDMIGEKWLSNVIFTTVESGADIRKVGNGVNGDFQPGALSRAINTPEVNEITVRSWMAKAVSRKSTLVFCVDLNHVTSLTAMFRRFGFEAQFVTGDTPKKIRSERLDAFRNGDFPVLLNCGVFTEGTDIPNIDCVLLARPTKSRNLLVQMIGRGMRLHVGKENCHIIDMVTSLNTGIVSTPTLFGLDPAAVVENATVDEMENLKERKEQERRRESEVAARQEAPLPSSKGLASSVITFTDYDSVAEMIEDTAEERLIRQLSQFAWVCVGDNRYVLSSRDGGHLAIELGAEGFMVKYIQKLPSSVKSKSPFARPRHVAKAGTLEHAVHAADTFAADVFDYNYIGKHQFWRRQPASEKQLAFLNKFRDKGSQLMLESCSKGKAADMITKLKHGARGRHERSQVQKRNVQKMIMKDQQLKELADREHVRVGPIRIPSHASAVEG